MIDKEKKVTSLKAKMNLKRSLSDKFADRINSAFGSMAFFTAHVCFFTLWVILNTGLIPGINSFDPYPFGFLTMVVSLEAIFLSIFVLISQNRESDVADLREEVDLQLNVHAEQEITRILIMLDKIHDKLGLKHQNDQELKQMERKLNLGKIEKKILEEMEE